MAETIKARITVAQKTESEWLNSDVILLKGEIGIASDTQVIKVGNGSDKWANLKSHKGEKGDSLTVSKQTKLSNGNIKLVLSDKTEVVIPKGEPFTFNDLTPKQIDQIKAKEIDLSNYATKSDLANVDVSGQLKNYTTNVGIDDDGFIAFNRDGNWYTTDASTPYRKQVAFKDHKHEITDINNLQTSLNNKANENHTHREYIRNVGVDDDGFIAFDMDGNWYTTNASTPYRKQVAFKDHKHREYLRNVGVTDDGYITFNMDGNWYTTDARTPYRKQVAFKYHTHAITDIKGLKDALDDKSFINQRTGSKLKYWCGSQADYNRISTKDPNTIYDVWE